MVNFLPMLISHSIVLACFYLKISLIHFLDLVSFDGLDFFLMLSDLVVFLFCIANDAKRSFASLF